MANPSMQAFLEAAGQTQAPGLPPVIGRHPHSGLPVRGERLPWLKPDELETLPERHIFGCAKFELWKPEEMTAYSDQMQRAYNGLIVIRVKQIVDEPAHGAPRVYLEWTEPYVTVDGVL